jgi:hypothetical protein
MQSESKKQRQSKENPFRRSSMKPLKSTSNEDHHYQSFGFEVLEDSEGCTEEPREHLTHGFGLVHQRITQSTT